MSFMGYIPDAPLPPRPAHVELGPHQPLDFQHQLLYKAQELRSRAIPVAPRPPAPMRIDRGIMRSEWDLASQLVLALIRLKAGRVPLAPPPPAPARFRVWPALMLARPLDDELKLAAQRLRPVRRIPRAPLAPAPARLTVKPWALPFDQVIAKASTDFYANRRKALPRDVQEEAVRAAKDMRKALAEHNPPLAPAAPAPVLSASAPLAKPVELEAAKAAKEMTIAHYPPLAPANPAPDMIAKDAVLTKPLQEKLVPAAIKAMQNVEHPPMIVPDAPPAPPAYRARRDFIMAQPFKDLLYTTVKQKKLARKQHQAKLDFVPVPRALEATHAVVPPVVAAPAKVAPPLPPRPAESLAAIEAMRGLRGNMVVHDKEKVIQHAPIVEKEIVNERPVEVKHEHHIQPVVHEVEHRIQPIIKTEATTATTIIETDKSVMLPPIVEPAVTVSATPVVAPVAAPMAVPSVSVPQTRAAPITTATVLPYLPMASYGAGQGMLDSEERMGLGVVAPIMPGEKEIVLEGLSRKERKSHRKHGAALSPTAVPDTTLGTGAHSRTGTALSPNTSTATRGRRGSIGMKIKGAVKEVTGTLTRNPAKVEEGKMLMHGVDPATNPSAASSSSVSSTSRI